MLMEGSMLVSEITFENYKSFYGPETIKIGETVTPVIGKNESGKSNLIDLLGYISLKSKLPKSMFETPYRGRNDDPLKIDVKLKLNENEQQNLSLESEYATVYISEGESNYGFDGFLEEYFSKEEFLNLFSELKASLDQFCELIDSGTGSTLRQNYTNLEVEKTHIHTNYSQTHRDFQTRIKRNNSENKDLASKIISLSKKIEGYVRRIYQSFPIFYKYNEMRLRDSYVLNDDFFEKYDSQDDGIKNFITATGVSTSVFKIAALSSNPGERRDARRKIERAVKEKIEIPFNKFYTQEKITLDLEFNGSRIYLLVTSANKSMRLSERSNGLKWYLNLFISLLAREITGTIFFLIDEPGVFLHVDAQAYLLKLFNELAVEHQILYTTHSPFMIDINNIQNLRYIIKEDGKSKIYNKAHNIPLDTNSNHETLSPIYKAIGLSRTYGIPCMKSPPTVITEGKLDCRYIIAMCPNIAKNISFLPGTGAGNALYLANILKGWGTDFVVLFDDDNQGRAQKEKLLRNGIEENRIIMVSEALDNVDSHKEKVEIENLISKEDFNTLGFQYDALKSNQKEAAVKKLEGLSTSEYNNLSPETRNNFDRLAELIENAFFAEV